MKRGPRDDKNLFSLSSLLSVHTTNAHVQLFTSQFLVFALLHVCKGIVMLVNYIVKYITL